MRNGDIDFSGGIQTVRRGRKFIRRVRIDEQIRRRRRCVRIDLRADPVDRIEVRCEIGNRSVCGERKCFGFVFRTCSAYDDVDPFAAHVEADVRAAGIAHVQNGGRDAHFFEQTGTIVETEIDAAYKKSRDAGNDYRRADDRARKETFAEMYRLSRHYFTLQLMLTVFLRNTSVLKSNMRCDTNKAVNTEETTPIAKLTAKPWIAPLPS